MVVRGILDILKEAKLLTILNDIKASVLVFCLTAWLSKQLQCR